MRLFEVIDAVRNAKRGYEISEEEILKAISAVEKDIYLNIICGREGDEKYSDLQEYNIETDSSTMLIAPVPYDDIYRAKVCCEIDLRYEDSERYQIDYLIYENLFKELKRFWWKTHRQKRRYNYF